MSIAYGTFGCFLRWLIRMISWLGTLNWPDITESWAMKELLNSKHCPISLLAWTSSAQQPGEELLAHSSASSGCIISGTCVTLSVPLPSHFHLACFQSLCGVLSLWKFSSDCGAVCGDLMASTASPVYITVCDLGSQVPLLEPFWLCCSPFPWKRAVLCISYVQRQQLVLCGKPWCSKKTWSLD